MLPMSFRTSSAPLLAAPLVAFAKNAGVTDARTIAILNHKGRTELQEATLQYKTKAQLMAFLERITKTDKQLAEEADEDADFFKM